MNGRVTTRSHLIGNSKKSIVLSFLAPTSGEPYISKSIRVCLSLRENSSILTSELNNSAPDHLIELKFGTLNHLRMYIMMLMSEQLSTAVISCQQLFFTSRSPKIDVRGLLGKSLFSKMFWKLSVDEF